MAGWGCEGEEGAMWRRWSWASQGTNRLWHYYCVYRNHCIHGLAPGLQTSECMLLSHRRWAGRQPLLGLAGPCAAR